MCEVRLWGVGTSCGELQHKLHWFYKAGELAGCKLSIHLMCNVVGQQMPIWVSWKSRAVISGVWFNSSKYSTSAGGRVFKWKFTGMRDAVYLSRQFWFDSSFEVEHFALHPDKKKNQQANQHMNYLLMDPVFHVQMWLHLILKILSSFSFKGIAACHAHNYILIYWEKTVEIR